MAKVPQDHKKKQEKKTRATADITTARGWKRSSDVATRNVPLEVPSGNTCLVRPVGMQAFIAEGLIPNSLMGIVTTALEAGEKGETVDEDAVVEQFIEDIKADPDRVMDMIRMADACTVYCVIEPKVMPSPKGAEERDPDVLYVDEVDLDDKMFIMNFAVGGTRDLEPFREAVARGVESLPPGEAVG
jgi:hypothetical protein